MQKLKQFIIATLLSIKFGIILLTFGFVSFGIFHLLSTFFEAEMGKEVLKIITSDFFIIGILAFGIWGYVQKKSWIYNLKMLGMALIGYFIFLYKKSLQIFKTASLRNSDLKFLILPFYGKIYFDLSEIDKKLLKEPDVKTVNIIQNLNQYFRSKAKLSSMRVIDYKVKNLAMEIDFYRGVNIEASQVERIENEDILNGIGLSVDKYLLEKYTKNNVRVLITKKQNDTIYNIGDYVENFDKDTIHFGFDMLGNEVKHKLDFSHANHFGVYGKTGFGKTNFTSSLAYGLYKANQDYNFIIIDPKGDCNQFNGIERVLYAHEVEDIYKLLQRVRKNMKRVGDIFRENKVRNYKEYHEYVTEKSDLVKPTFIFIEEFSKLMASIQDNAMKEEIISIVRELAIAGRSFCYNIVFSLQVPLKKIINDSEISRMLIPITFSIENTMNHHIFGTAINKNLEDLDLGEAIMKNGYKIHKFKTYHLDKKTFDKLEDDYKVSNSIEDNYLSHAQKINSFSKKEALEFGLQRGQFDELSRKLQSQGIISKAPNNSLYFTSKK